MSIDRNLLVRFRNVEKMVGVDATEKVVEQGRSRCEEEGLADRIEFILADVTQSGLEDNSSDFVWGEDAWCYVVDKAKLISEATRIVKSGGKIAFTDWIEGEKGLTEAELILLEPIYHTIIQLPPNYIKSTLSLLSKYSAKIINVNQEKEYQATIEILLPVRNAIKFTEDIRSTTSGRAFWQNEFYAFMEVPKHETNTIINDLRFIKGLSW